MRIGYAPYSADLRQPADRRRFPFHAARRRIEFELADPREAYDVVVGTPRADLGAWSRYRPGRSKVVVDIVDSYLDIPRTDPKALLLGRGARGGVGALEQVATGEPAFARMAMRSSTSNRASCGASRRTTGPERPCIWCGPAAALCGGVAVSGAES